MKACFRPHLRDSTRLARCVARAGAELRMEATTTTSCPGLVDIQVNREVWEEFCHRVDQYQSCLRRMGCIE